MAKNEAEKLRKIEKLIETIDKIYPSTRELIWKSFLRGVFVGLGTTIGASIVLALVTYTISQLKVIPIVKQIIIQTNVEDILP